jgi:hypothetical protein
MDRNISELFTVSAVGVNVNKYLGPNSQGANPDLTLPSNANATEKSIQDLLFLENRDRKYDRSVYQLRCHYTVQDTDFNLSQFGLFVTNDTLFFTFHTNDMIETMGRKLMPGDVLEFPHLREFFPLDPNDEIPIALRKYYVVQEATRASEGFAPTWWNHLWRCKCTPMVDGQEYRDILEQEVTNYATEGATTSPNPIKDYLSTYAKNVNINDRIIEEAERLVPTSGYDSNPQYVISVDANGNSTITNSINSDSVAITMDSIVLHSDYSQKTPDTNTMGYLIGDGLAPDGYPVKALTYFPDNSIEGEYVLRLDYFPNRLFRFDGRRWVVMEDKVRNPLTGDNNQNQLGTFVNNRKTTRLSDGTTVAQKQPLSTLLSAKADT